MAYYTFFAMLSKSHAGRQFPTTAVPPFYAFFFLVLIDSRVGDRFTVVHFHPRAGRHAFIPPFPRDWTGTSVAPTETLDRPFETPLPPAIISYLTQAFALTLFILFYTYSFSTFFPKPFFFFTTHLIYAQTHVTESPTFFFPVTLA